MDNTFFGYCHLCEEVSEITETQRRNGMILWECPVCGAYNDEEDTDAHPGCV